VEAKLRSPHEVLQARGRDPEQVLDEWAEWKQMLEERDLADPPEKSQLVTNPAAVAKQPPSRILALMGGKDGRVGKV
jgi:hypothetical protein